LQPPKQDWSLLNLNALGNDNTTGLGYEQVIGPSGNLCDATYDNVSIDNFTGTLLTNNCQEGVFFSLYIPLFASEDYLLALYADGPNVNDINNLVNSVDLEGLSNEINNLWLLLILHYHGKMSIVYIKEAGNGWEKEYIRRL